MKASRNGSYGMRRGEMGYQRGPVSDYKQCNYPGISQRLAAMDGDKPGPAQTKLAGRIALYRSHLLHSAV